MMISPLLLNQLSSDIILSSTVNACPDDNSRKSRWIQMVFGTQVYEIETKAKFKSVTLKQMLSELLHFVIFMLNCRMRKVAIIKKNPLCRMLLDYSMSQKQMIHKIHIHFFTQLGFLLF